jgi:hypothetical protein
MKICDFFASAASPMMSQQSVSIKPWLIRESKYVDMNNSPRNHVKNTAALTEEDR